MASPQVVAEIVRSGFVEGHHYGSVVALAADGRVDWSVGAVDVPILPRSCNKPIQALAMVRLGLDLPDELLALVCASHSGEPFHLEGVRRILAVAGIDERALQTPPDYPLDDDAREAMIRAGVAKNPDRDELLGQARRDAGHLRAQRLGPRDLPRARPPAAAGHRRDVRRADRGAGGRGRRRRLRGAAALGLAHRAGPGVRPARDRARRTRGPGGRRDPRTTRSGCRAPAATSAPC